MMISRVLLALFVVTPMHVLAQRIEYTLSVPGDTTRNYYITVHPESEVRGAIILLPGFGELPRQTIADSDIYKSASRAGYMTIIPALGDWSFFYIDDKSHEKLRIFIDEVFAKYNLREETFFIGGHSFGGTMAMQYAQKAGGKNSMLKKSAGVFAVDPPLDLERLYNCMTTNNRPPKHPVSMQEDNYIASRMVKAFGRDPGSDPQFFWDVSPYSQSDVKHRSLSALLTTPVRVYNEPDINWYIENRRVDFYCINALDSAAMINWLRSMGNANAELIVTTGKGFRESGKIRHPHSWSIVDSEELLEWMKRAATIK